MKRKNYIFSLASALLMGTMALSLTACSSEDNIVNNTQQPAGAQPQAGAAPDNNGGGAEAPEVTISTQYVMDPALSYEENMRRKKEFEASRK